MGLRPETVNGIVWTLNGISFATYIFQHARDFLQDKAEKRQEQLAVQTSRRITAPNRRELATLYIINESELENQIIRRYCDIFYYKEDQYNNMTSKIINWSNKKYYNSNFLDDLLKSNYQIFHRPSLAFSRQKEIGF